MLIKEKCFDCDGGGQFFKATGPLFEGNIPGEWSDCIECGGSGFKERELTLEERVERLEEAIGEKEAQ